MPSTRRRRCVGRCRVVSKLPGQLHVVACDFLCFSSPRDCCPSSRACLLCWVSPWCRRSLVNRQHWPAPRPVCCSGHSSCPVRLVSKNEMTTSLAYYSGKTWLVQWWGVGNGAAGAGGVTRTRHGTVAISATQKREPKFQKRHTRPRPPYPKRRHPQRTPTGHGGEPSTGGPSRCRPAVSTAAWAPRTWCRMNHSLNMRCLWCLCVRWFCSSLSRQP